MKNLVLTLQPEQKFYDHLLEIKNEMFRKFGNSQYLLDPPHLTLYVFPCESLERMITEFEPPKFSKRIEIEKWFTFPMDPITKKITLVSQLDESTITKLRSLQGKCIDQLNKYRLGQICERYSNLHSPNLEISNSISKTGYPFTGNFWVPHFTIASFENETYEKIKDYEFPKGNFKLQNYRLYELLEDDSIKIIKDF